MSSEHPTLKGAVTATAHAGPSLEEKYREETEILRALMAGREYAEAARELPYLSPEVVARVRREYPELGKYAPIEQMERAKKRAYEAAPIEARAKSLPTLKPEVYKPGTTPLEYWLSWEDALTERPALREQAIAEAVADIRKGYWTRFVWVATEYGNRYRSELSIRYPDDVLSEAWSRVGAEERATMGPEQYRRQYELVTWLVNVKTGRAPDTTPAPFPHSKAEFKVANSIARVVILARAATPYAVLDAENLNTALTYGYRLAEWDRVIRWQGIAISTALVASSFALIGLGELVTLRLVAAGFARGTSVFLGSLAMWRVLTFKHAIMGQLMPVDRKAHAPYSKLTDAIKDLLFSIQSLPGIAVAGLIIADLLGYLEVPRGEGEEAATIPYEAPEYYKRLMQAFPPPTPAEER